MEISVDLAEKVRAELCGLVSVTKPLDVITSGLGQLATELDYRIFASNLLKLDGVIVSKPLAERLLDKLNLIAQMDDHAMCLCTCDVNEKRDALKWAIAAAA